MELSNNGENESRSAPKLVQPVVYGRLGHGRGHRVAGRAARPAAKLPTPLRRPQPRCSLLAGALVLRCCAGLACCPAAQRPADRCRDRLLRLAERSAASIASLCRAGRQGHHRALPRARCCCAAACAVLRPCCAAAASLAHVTALPTSLSSSFAEPPCTELKRAVRPPVAPLPAKWRPKLSLHVGDRRKHRLPPLRR